MNTFSDGINVAILVSIVFAMLQEAFILLIGQRLTITDRQRLIGGGIASLGVAAVLVIILLLLN